MTANAESKRPEQRVGRTYTAFDRALIDAKMNNREIEISLACSVWNPREEDDELFLVCKVVSVDVFTVEIDWPPCGGTIWINKSAMIGTRIINENK